MEIHHRRSSEEITMPGGHLGQFSYIAMLVFACLIDTGSPAKQARRHPR
jgi:hypothetical protein